MTPQEIAMQKAEELYLRNPRWRQIVDSTAVAAIDSTKAHEGPHQLARETALLMLGRIFCESGELAMLEKHNQVLMEQTLQFARLSVQPPSFGVPAALLPIAERKNLPALRSAHAWLERWARHVGNCQGGPQCTCGLTAVQSEAAIAIQNHDFPEEKQP